MKDSDPGNERYSEHKLNPCQFPSPDSSPTGGVGLPPTNTDGANYSKFGVEVSSRGSQGVDWCGIMGSSEDGE